MEQAFSIFLFVQDGYINEIGYVCYPISVDDSTMANTMRSNVCKDFVSSKKVELSSAILLDDYQASSRLGTQLKHFEQIFKQENAVADPLILTTYIVDGQPKVDLVADHSPFLYTEEVQKTSCRGSGVMPDYLEHYMTKNGFNTPSLINDDYYTAIRLLFNNGLYISCAKLLLSCIDSIGFVEFGNEGNVFVKWLNTYSDLSVHGVTAEEVWELRNGLLHMTNLDSNKVLQGKRSRIMLYVGHQLESEREVEGFKLLNLYTFMTNTIPQAISKWIQSYNDEPSKMESFIKRYDLTVSDIRVIKAHV